MKHYLCKNCERQKVEYTSVIVKGNDLGWWTHLDGRYFCNVGLTQHAEPDYGQETP